MLLAFLRKNISSILGDHLEIDPSKFKKDSEMHKVLDNQSRGGVYFRYFLRPLVDKCDCATCREGMFSPIIMPAEDYTELREK